MSNDDFEFDETAPTNILVGHDGSESARAGLALVTEWLFKRKANVTIDVLHIYDDAKQADCPRNYKKTTIGRGVTHIDGSMVSWLMVRW